MFPLEFWAIQKSHSLVLVLEGQEVMQDNLLRVFTNIVNVYNRKTSPMEFHHNSNKQKKI